ncbi:DoxX family protein [Paenibacillus pasadenensis]|uniref:DoxX family protein n=1 Tax=Paenibacillus pasadenensis TaxID=217090 RepID=UPI0003FCD031|nr:DoxX family protein [Paenibacillus pasadenensis]
MSMQTGTAASLNASPRSRGKAAAYWTVTLFFAAAMLLSGLGQLMRLEGNIELVRNLGYPLYLMTILGIWKALGVVAIVVPGFPRLKEWAYAGFFFLMTGAAWSHALDHEYGFPVFLPLAYAALAAASWALRPHSRKL